MEEAELGQLTQCRYGLGQLLQLTSILRSKCLCGSLCSTLQKWGSRLRVGCVTLSLVPSNS